MPTAYFIPLRLQCARAVIDLCDQTGVYAPVAPLLLEVRGLVSTEQTAWEAGEEPLASWVGGLILLVKR